MGRCFLASKSCFERFLIQFMIYVFKFTCLKYMFIILRFLRLFSIRENPLCDR